MVKAVEPKDEIDCRVPPSAGTATIASNARSNMPATQKLYTEVEWEFTFTSGAKGASGEARHCATLGSAANIILWHNIRR